MDRGALQNCAERSISRTKAAFFAPLLLAIIRDSPTGWYEDHRSISTVTEWQCESWVSRPIELYIYSWTNRYIVDSFIFIFIFLPFSPFSTSTSIRLYERKESESSECNDEGEMKMFRTLYTISLSFRKVHTDFKDPGFLKHTSYDTIKNRRPWLPVQSLSFQINSLFVWSLRLYVRYLQISYSQNVLQW